MTNVPCVHSSRLQEREELLTALALLVDPIRRAIYSAEDQRKLVPYLASCFAREFSPFIEMATRFCRPGDHRFDTELDWIVTSARAIGTGVYRLKHPELLEEARRNFPRELQACQDRIRAVPCADSDLIATAGSPFTTYLRLRAHCTAAKKRVEVFDPYLSPDTYHRYLAGIDQRVQILVLTDTSLMRASSGSPSAISRRDAIVSVSDLLAIERPTSYRFMVSPSIHDRHLRIDAEIFHVGGSLKDAAKRDAFTITSHDSTCQSHQALDSLIQNAEIWYAPGMAAHRRC